MKKKSLSRHSNTTLNLTPHYKANLFDSGGPFANMTTAGLWDDSTKATLNNASGDGSVSGVFAGVEGMLESGLQNAKLKSTYNIQRNIADNFGQALSNQNINTNDQLMEAWDQYSPMSHISRKDIRGGSTLGRLWNTNMASIKGAEAGWNTGAGPIGAIIGGVVGLGTGIAGWVTGGRKASRLRDRINNEIDIANEFGYQNLAHQQANVEQKNLLRAEGNYVAYGGSLDKRLAGHQMQDIYGNGIPSANRFAGGGELYENEYIIPRGKQDNIIMFGDDMTQEQLEARNQHSELFAPINFVDYSSPKDNKFAGGGNTNAFVATEPVDEHKSSLESLMPLIMKAKQLREEKQQREAELARLNKEVELEKLRNETAKNYIAATQGEVLTTNSNTPTATPIIDLYYEDPSEELYQDLMSREGFLETPEIDKGNGKWTIGYGDQNEELNNYYLTHKDEKYTREQGRKQLEKTVSWVRNVLAKKIPNWKNLTGPQKDALTSYGYNTGPGTIVNSKAFMNAITNENWEEVANNMNAGYNSADLPGLRKRRDFERLAFLYPSMSTYGIVPTEELQKSAEQLNNYAQSLSFGNGGNLFAYGNPPTKAYPRLTQAQHLKELQALAAKYPELEGISTKEFVPWLNALAGTESTYNPHARSVNKGGKKGSYVGYYQLHEKELGNDYSPDNQFKKAFKHLAGIFKNQMTKEDVLQAKKKGITPMQALYKYWNQGNRVTNWLYYNKDKADGAETLISEYGNDYNPKDTYDYSNYLRDANKAPYYVLRPGDGYYKASLGARNPSLIYNYTNYGVTDFPYNKKYPATQVGDTVALVNQPIEQFRKTVKAWDAKHAFGGNLIPPKKQALLDRINSTSKANFVERAKDPNRKSITLKDGKKGTHLLGWATEDNHAVVYPQIQEIDGNLVLFDNWRDAYNSAVERGDTLRMTPKEAKWYTKNYKEHYPFANGGNLFEEGRDVKDPKKPVLDLTLTKETLLNNNTLPTQKDNTKVAILQGEKAEKVLKNAQKEQERRAAVVEKEKLEAIKKSPHNFEATRKLEGFNQMPGYTSEPYMYTDEYRNSLGFIQKLFGLDTPIYPVVEGAGAVELFSPTPQKLLLPVPLKKELLPEYTSLEEKIFNSVLPNRKFVQKPRVLSEKELDNLYKGNVEYRKNAANSKMWATEKLDKIRIKENFFPNETEERYINILEEAIPEIAKTIKEEDIHPFFTSQTIDGVQYPSQIVEEYRKYLQSLGVTTSKISDRSLAKVLTARYKQLSSTATGKTKDMLFFHGSKNSGDALKEFKFEEHLGDYTQNTGAIGPGNYFSLVGSRYGGEKGVTQPYIINNVEHFINGQRTPEYGFFETFSPVYVGRKMSPVEIMNSKTVQINKAKSAPKNLLFYDSREPLPGRNDIFDSILYPSFSGAYPNGFALKRNTGVKSVFPHPAMFIKDSEGKWKVANTDWNSPYLNFKQGGKLKK